MSDDHAAAVATVNADAEDDTDLRKAAIVASVTIGKNVEIAKKKILAELEKKVRLFSSISNIDSDQKARLETIKGLIDSLNAKSAAKGRVFSPPAERAVSSPVPATPISGGSSSAFVFPPKTIVDEASQKSVATKVDEDFQEVKRRCDEVQKRCDTLEKNYAEILSVLNQTVRFAEQSAIINGQLMEQIVRGGLQQQQPATPVIQRELIDEDQQQQQQQQQEEEDEEQDGEEQFDQKIEIIHACMQKNFNMFPKHQNIFKHSSVDDLKRVFSRRITLMDHWYGIAHLNNQTDAYFHSSSDH